MTHMTLTIYDGKVNVDMDTNTVTLTGVEVAEVVEEIGYIKLLQEMDIQDIKQFVSEVDDDMAMSNFEQGRK